MAQTGSTNTAFLNLLFLAVAVAGFFLIADPTQPDEIRTWGPTVLVAVYGLIVHAVLRPCDDRSVAEHFTDSVYFLGFLFTLAAMVVLFARLSGIAGVAGRGEALIATALSYVGISVTTSLAGVLVRGMVRGAYLRHHPEPTVDTIEAFLAERAATVDALAGREREYLEALTGYVEATRRFSAGLTAAEEQLIEPVERMAGLLERQSQAVDRFEDVQQRLVQTAESIHREAGALPWSEVGEEMVQFRTGVRELNEVLDGLVTVLEQKVERIN